MKNYNRKKIGKFGTYYYLDDKLHRIDGPAVEWSNGYRHKEWYINGKFIGGSWQNFTQKSFEQYLKLLLLK